MREFTGRDGITPLTNPLPAGRNASRLAVSFSHSFGWGSLGLAWPSRIERRLVTAVVPSRKLRYPTDSLPSQIHSVNRIATWITRPIVSISFRYLHRRLEAGDRGWGITVNHSESLSNSHQPQTKASRVIRKYIGRWNSFVQSLRDGIARFRVSIWTIEPAEIMGSNVRSRFPMMPLL
jgi:hypothetical protein